MNRIEKTFKDLDRTALVSFITAGDPDYETSLSVLKTLPGAGVDIIELGMPFTDPVADGPTIQQAGLRALEGGANMHKTLDMVREFRAENTETPIILMGYTNPVMAFGIETFAAAAHEAGVDGLIIVDLPPEESQELEQAAEKHGISLIRLVTPTTDAERLKTLLRGASGFLYYVSITGVTGSASADLSAIKPHIEEIKKHTDLPVAVGFGIKTPEDAKEMAQISDAIVVGSAIVQEILENKDNPAQAVEKKVKSLSDALSG
jgi:tryptophan synthase alpha chain